MSLMVLINLYSNQFLEQGWTSRIGNEWTGIRYCPSAGKVVTAVFIIL